MKLALPRPRFWIAFFSAVGVLSLALVDAERTSPGPLAAVHELTPELSGSSGCSDCHGGWRSTMTASCLECHGAIEAQVGAGSGLHGVLEDVQACARCHSEHHGTNFSLVNRRSFALAGIADPAHFDHLLVGFAMGGKHLELACAQCHVSAEAAILPQGTHRYIGLDHDCATCHEDEHKGRLKPACSSCHGQQDFQALESLGHESHLPLVGGHAVPSCRDCHAKTTPHAFEAMGWPRFQGSPRTCLDCHESPHAGRFTAAAADAAALPVEAACVVCHAAEHTSFRDEHMALSPAQHAASGFPIDPPHAEVACADCHAAELADFAARYPGRGADACAACHEDPHGGQFAETAAEAADCLACHERLRFEPHGFTVERHAATVLPLDGQHLESECAACHVEPAGGGPRVFRGTPARCEECHADAHAGFFALFAADAGPIAAGECARCHGTTSFAALPAGFDHGRWTGFPIEGAHAQAECAICHEASAEPDALGRSFGRVEERFGAPEGCVTCHADPHEGAFEAAGLPAEFEGRTGCERCHDANSFRSLPHGFDHRLWTGHRLEGAHAALACSECHETLRRPDEHGRTWARAKGVECGDCHADPHAGQFERGGRTDCMRCHRSAEAFTVLAFRHDVHSRFPLDEAHEAVACAGCHAPWTLPDGREVVRYRPLTRECLDCHGRTEDQMRRLARENKEKR